MKPDTPQGILDMHKAVTKYSLDIANEIWPIQEEFERDDGLEDLPFIPIVGTELASCITRFPLFYPSWCDTMLSWYKTTHKFKPNTDEDEYRQIPELVLENEDPEMFSSMIDVVRDIIDPIIWSKYGQEGISIASVQLAHYNPKGKQKGAWHHDVSADFTIVVPLNTNDYTGGGTDFFLNGEVVTIPPISTGEALLFPSLTHMHRGLAVTEGDRYLLVFWLYYKDRVVELVKNMT